MCTTLKGIPFMFTIRQLKGKKKDENHIYTKQILLVKGSKSQVPK